MDYLPSINPNDRGDLSSQLASRIDSLNRIPLGKGVILAISLASFFAYYDISNYAYISPSIKVAWSLEDSDIALGASMTVLGYVIGSIGITAYADRYGRKPALIISILVLAIGSIFSSLSQNMTQMVLFRLVTGVGIGSEIAVVGAYIAEMSPKSRRGRYISLVVVLGWTGITLSGPIALSLIQSAENNEALLEPWRVILGIAVIPAFIGLILRMKLPESLRWLLSKGKLRETNQALMALGLDPITDRSGADVERYEISARSSSPHQRGNNKLANDSGSTSSGISVLKRYITTRVLPLVTVWFLVLIPIYASLLLVTEYVQRGYDVVDSILINVLASTGFVAGGLWSIAAGDKFERKYQIAVASAIMAIAFILRGVLIQDYSGLVISSFIAFWANAWLITTLITYTGENFPTRIRSTGTGIVEGIGRLIASSGPFIFVALQPFGFLSLMVGLSLFPLLASIIMIAVGRNTLGLSLEKLNR